MNEETNMYQMTPADRRRAGPEMSIKEIDGGWQYKYEGMFFPCKYLVFATAETFVPACSAESVDSKMLHESKLTGDDGVREFLSGSRELRPETVEIFARALLQCELQAAYSAKVGVLS